MALLNDIRDVMDSSGITRYRVAQETGLSQSLLSRVMSGERALSIATAEALLDYFGYEIVVRPKSKRSKGGK